MKLSGIVNTKQSTYIYKVQPDIAVRGGIYGAGTRVSIWRINPKTRKAIGHRGFQGAFNLNRVKNLISLWERHEPTATENKECSVCGHDCKIFWHK